MSGQDAKPGAYVYKISVEERNLGFIVVPIIESIDREILVYSFDDADKVVENASVDFKIASFDSGANNILENIQGDEGFLQALIQFFDPNTSVQIIKVVGHGQGKNPVALYYEVSVQGEDIVLSKTTSFAQAAIHAKSEVARINLSLEAAAKDLQLIEKHEFLGVVSSPYRVRLGRASSP